MNSPAQLYAIDRTWFERQGVNDTVLDPDNRTPNRPAVLLDLRRPIATAEEREAVIDYMTEQLGWDEVEIPGGRQILAIAHVQVIPRKD